MCLLSFLAVTFPLNIKTPLNVEMPTCSSDVKDPCIVRGCDSQITTFLTAIHLSFRLRVDETHDAGLYYVNNCDTTPHVLWRTHITFGAFNESTVNTVKVYTRIYTQMIFIQLMGFSQLFYYDYKIETVPLFQNVIICANSRYQIIFCIIEYLLYHKCIDRLTSMNKLQTGLTFSSLIGLCLLNFGKSTDK